MKICQEKPITLDMLKPGVVFKVNKILFMKLAEGQPYNVVELLNGNLHNMDIYVEVAIDNGEYVPSN